MTEIIITVPDIGGAEDVDVIELCVAIGDVVELEQSVIVLETDKATMEIPALQVGSIVEWLVKEGDKVSEGTAIYKLKTDAEQSEDAAPSEVKAESEQTEDKSTNTDASEKSVSTDTVENTSAVQSSREVTVCVPDLGDVVDVDIIEMSVSEGDELAEGDTIIVVETDKASIEVPSSHAGTVVKCLVAEGGKINSGDDLLVVKTQASASAPEAASKKPETKKAAAPTTKVADEVVAQSSSDGNVLTTSLDAQPGNSAIVSGVETLAMADKATDVYAGPSVRSMARKLGADLTQIKGTGPRGRIQKADVREFIKSRLSAPAAVGSVLPSIPDIDFSKFGEIELKKMSKIAKLTVKSMQRSWLNVPHVTQFDEADITDLEEFRTAMKPEMQQREIKLSPLPFMLKACAIALQDNPGFNCSLHNDGEHIVQKKYIHIGIAVDTPNGLVVPVIRDVDKKGIWQLAAEMSEMAAKARIGKLLPSDMQGGCFTISSLGAIGGNGFTPIVNTPEVAILGVSKAQIKPLWNGSEFIPRNMLPLSVSYDHRAINGADCGRFFTQLVALLSDVRRLAL